MGNVCPHANAMRPSAHAHRLAILRLAPRPPAVGSLRIPPHGRIRRHHGLCPWGSIAWACGASAWLCGLQLSVAADQPPWPSVQLTPEDRILILAPHPDDEVLGCGGIIQRAMAMHLPLRLVFFTYGDNNQWSFLVYRKRLVLGAVAVQGMGLVRHDEGVAAAQVLGLSPDHLTFLGYPDFGTLEIWKSHWGDRPPLRGMLTRVVAVPYANALRPGAAYKGEEIVGDLMAVLRDFRPTKIFLSHPGDHMPDHAALYLFTRVALWTMGSELEPKLYPYLIHFKGWPWPHGFRPDESLEPPSLFRDDAAWHSLALVPEEVERKHAAIQAHRTQYASSARYLRLFMRANELFGDFPPVALGRSVPAVALSAGRKPSATEAPEELTDAERAAFVGLETRAIQLDGDQLVVSIGFSRSLGQAVSASVYAFGYRADRPFAQMPKLHIKVGTIHHAVYDQRRRIPEGALRVSHRPRQLTIRIPLAMLGNPEKILTSAQTSLGQIPLDTVSWRVLELPHRQAGVPLTEKVH